MSNKFVLNADDLGMSEANNRAVLEGYECGILKSASIVSNGEAFNDAAGRIIKACPDLCIGVHLNITDGKSLLPDLNTLTDENGIFYNSPLFKTNFFILTLSNFIFWIHIIIFTQYHLFLIYCVK